MSTGDRPDRRRPERDVVIVDRQTYGSFVLRRAGRAVRTVAVVGYLLCAVAVGLAGYAVVTAFADGPGERTLGEAEVLGVPAVAAGFVVFALGFVLVAGALVTASLRRDRSGSDR